MRRREFLRMMAAASAAPALAALLAAKGARAPGDDAPPAGGACRQGADTSRRASYPRDMHAEGQPYTPLRPTA